MDSEMIALSVIMLSALTGFLATQSAPEFDAYSVFETQSDEPQKPSNPGSSLVYGSTHEHALMYVVVNGTEIDFLEPEYQLASRYVHLENNRSHIVHKHAEEVTWNYFFDTLKIKVERNGTEACLEFGEKKCYDNARLILNGEPADFSSEIQQGDRLVLAFGDNASRIVEDYSNRQLPPDYKPQRSRGRRI